MPLECLHTTVLEVTHSQKESEILRLVDIMKSKIPSITDYTFSRRARLVKPMLSYDASAIALSFVPAAGEEPCTTHDRSADTYTYHHLRRDIHALSRSTGIDVASRYVVPSSHITVARFVRRNGLGIVDNDGIDKRKVEELVHKLASINARLQRDCWSSQAEGWQVGEEKGLVCRTGTVWYGGGQSEHEGRGF